jgi:hypothetical protein
MTSDLSISLLGMAIATVMTRLNDASFGCDDDERRCSMGYLGLTPAPDEGVSVPPMQRPALAFPDADLPNDKTEDP